MNGDVLELLRRADPARDSADYDHDRVDRQVARILQANAEPAPAARPRGHARRLGVPIVAFVVIAAAGLGTAAAAGWLSPQARNAFDSPAARQTLLALYGSTADLSKARERVNEPGPDGSTIATWTVPVAGRGVCTAILESKKSALPAGAGQPTDLPTECEPVPAPGQVQHSIRFTALEWRSRVSGTDYLIYSGPLGPATQVELRLANGVRLTATIGDGYFLLPALPAAKFTCAVLVGLDPLGHQVGLANYMTSGCPGDPYRSGPAATKPQPGATITENSPGQAVSYSDWIDVNVDTVMEQDPNRGAGSAAPGMSLVTVRLQFFQQPGQPTAFPTSVSFDLLYGDSHSPAAPDPGKHNDSDLNGDWNPPESNPGAWLPQRSFDVPTDQLATLQVRLNGDVSHPTIVFGNVHLQRSR